MCIKFKEPEIKITGKSIKAIETSYEIACATQRTAAKNAYLELLDQPDNKIPYNPKDDTIKTYNTLILILIINDFVLNGITAQPIKLKNKVKKGAKTNKNLLDRFGNTNSLTINFKASANGCNTPQKPVIFGPFLRCIAPITRRSANVKNATDIIKKINVNKVKISKIQ